MARDDHNPPRARRAGALAACVLSLGCAEGAGGPPARDGAADAITDAGAMIDDAATDVSPGDGGPLGRVVYPADRRHSPITEDLAGALRAIAEREPAARDRVFAKVGASATASASFLHCFASDAVELAGRDALGATIAHFLEGDAAGVVPFRRESLTAVPGWHAGRALEGDPSPLTEELDALEPRFAVVMYGTNDVGIVTAETYGRNMLNVVDALMDRGVVPVLSTVMPRDDSENADALVPLFNTIVRAIAQGRGVPLVDFHRELLPLPDHGLSADRVHPSTYVRGGASRPCVFDDAGLRHGYNLRNLITLEALDRLRRVTLDAEPAPDADARRLRGEGSPSAPFEIDALPFTDLRSTLFSEHRELDRYSGCQANQDESGPELVYRLALSAPSRLRALAVSREGVDVDLHLLEGELSEEACIARHDRELRVELEPGTYWLALDTYRSSEGERPGEYLLVLMPD